MAKHRKLFIAYVPVIHDGYIKALNRHPDAIVGVLATDVLSDIDYIRKDIRSLSPDEAKMALEGLGREVIIINRDKLRKILEQPVIMPDDDISRCIIENYPGASVTLEPTFLRWDRDNSSEETGVIPDRVVKINKSSEIIKTMTQELSASTNWWRHIGAVIHTDSGEVLVSSHNTPLPSEYSSLITGDPRITAHKGELIDQSIDIHAEANAIASAAKDGITLSGASISVSTFPCPTCAKLIAMSGINKCYFVEGYAILDGQNILKYFGVEIIKYDVNFPEEDQRGLKPYPSS